ncbi:MAG: MATE family efflux transporter [Myxococcota bacterium]
MSSADALKQELRHIFVLAVPMVVGQLSLLGLQTTDVVLVGHVDKLSLGGIALGQTISMFIFLMTMGIVQGMSTLISQAFGAGDKETCGRVLISGLYLSGVLGLLCTLMMQKAGWMLELLGQDPALSAIAQQYLVFLSLGYPFTLMFMALRYFTEGLGIAQPGMRIAMAALPVNAALGYLVLFEPFGLPSFGVAGMGAVTALVSFLLFVGMAWYVLGGARFEEYSLRRVWRGPRLGEIQNILAVGMPVGVAMTMEVGAFSAGALMMGKLGVVPMAAHQVVINLASLTFMVPMGIAMAGSVRVGQAVGSGDHEGMQRAGWTTLGASMGVMVLNGLIFLTLPEHLVRLYTPDVEVQALAVQILMVAAAFQIGDGVQVAGISILRGLKDTRIPMLISIAAYWGIGVGSAWLLGFKLEWGPLGIWWGLCLSLWVAAFCHVVRFAYRSRRL